MSEPHIIEKVDEIRSISHPMTEHERADYAILEYEKEIEDIQKAVEAIGSGIGKVMSERYIEMRLGMLDELHAQLLDADERVNAAVPHHRASVPASNRQRRKLMDELDTLRKYLLFRLKQTPSHIKLTIAHAAEHAPALAHAALQRMVYNK